jgi:hypothetical protein
MKKCRENFLWFHITESTVTKLETYFALYPPSLLRIPDFLQFCGALNRCILVSCIDRQTVMIETMPLRFVLLYKPQTSRKTFFNTIASQRIHSIVLHNLANKTKDQKIPTLTHLKIVNLLDSPVCSYCKM